MTQQEYQEMKQKEKLLKKQLAHIREKTGEFKNEGNRKNLTA